MRPGTSLEQQQGRGRQRRAEGATGVKEAKRQEMAQPVQEHTVPGAAFLLKDLRPPDERRPGALLTPLRLHESSLKGVKQRRPCAELGFGKVIRLQEEGGRGWKRCTARFSLFSFWERKKKMTNLLRSASLESFFFFFEIFCCGPFFSPKDKGLFVY